MLRVSENHISCRHGARAATLVRDQGRLVVDGETPFDDDALFALIDASRLIDENFAGVLAAEPPSSGSVYRDLAALGIAGGATYDGLVAFAARQHDATLVTRDARARGTYDVVRARVEVLV